MTWWKQFLEGCMIPGFWNRAAESTLQVGFLLRHHQTPRQSPTSLQAPKAENFPSELSGLSESSSNLLGSDGGVTWRWDFWLNKALTCDTGFSEFIWCQYVTCNYSVHICICKCMYMWYVCVYIYIYMHRYVFTCIHHILFESICIFQTMIMMSLFTSVIVVVPKALGLIVVSTGVSSLFNHYIYIYIVEVTYMVRVFVVHVLCRHLYFELAHQGFCAR